jgi:hypothetical protein
MPPVDATCSRAGAWTILFLRKIIVERRLEPAASPEIYLNFVMTNVLGKETPSQIAFPWAVPGCPASPAATSRIATRQ